MIEYEHEPVCASKEEDRHSGGGSRRARIGAGESESEHVQSRDCCCCCCYSAGSKGQSLETVAAFADIAGQSWSELGSSPFLPQLCLTSIQSQSPMLQYFVPSVV